MFSDEICLERRLDYKKMMRVRDRKYTQQENIAKTQTDRGDGIVYINQNSYRPSFKKQGIIL
jgi:hypothetical protein